MYVNEVLLSENNKNSTSNKLFVIKIGGNVIEQKTLYNYCKEIEKLISTEPEDEERKKGIFF